MTMAEAAAQAVVLDQFMALPGERAAAPALASHPLRQAFLYRVRLDAVRRQAAVDGTAIDPWHLAATIEGLRLRMDPYLRIIDRGVILDAARGALALLCAARRQVYAQPAGARWRRPRVRRAIESIFAMAAPPATVNQISARIGK